MEFCTSTPARRNAAFGLTATPTTLAVLATVRTAAMLLSMSNRPWMREAAVELAGDVALE